jgi:hypothetical protein
MKRLWRVLLNWTAAISLLLCAAIAGLWVHSYFRAYGLEYYNTYDSHGFSQSHQIVSKYGRIEWNWFQDTASGHPDRWPVAYFFGTNPLPSHRTPWLWQWTPGSHIMLGFLWRHDDYLSGSFINDIAIPYWFLILMFLVLPVRRIMVWFPKTSGLCAQCGYDLRATPERCPECGTIPTKKIIISN